MKLEVRNLKKKYGKKEVLKEINFTFEEGKIYGLLGRNGAGKTTFFNCLNRDVFVDEGRFYLDDEFGRNPLQTHDIGYVLATPVVPEFLTGREFIQFFIDINKERIKDLKDVDYYFNLVQLKKEDQNILLKDYSHGMKNKIQILIHIIANPKVILLDEPLTSLDIIVQEEMKSLLKKMKKDHIIIFSTHILELAMDLCDELVILSHKKLEIMDKNSISSKKQKDHIIQVLKDDKND